MLIFQKNYRPDAAILLQINFMELILELLKNSMVQISKTVLNVHFNKTETDRELIFQKL